MSKHSNLDANPNVLVSIITVCYNSELTIDRTLSSILHQSYPNIEYIVIDGASTDRTINIIEKYIPFFSERLLLVSEQDRGIYDAMNKGLALAKGDIIGIVNSDDWLDTDVIYSIVNDFLRNERAEAVYTGHLKFHYSGGKSQLLYSNQIRFNKMLRYKLMPIRHPATFVSKSVYKKIGLFDISFKINADKDFIYRCVKESITFYFIDKSLSNMSDSGISNSLRGSRSGLYDELLFAKKHSISSFAKIRLIVCYLFKELIKCLFPRCFFSLFRR